MSWVSIAERLPPEFTPVSTKIDDDRGERNVQTLKRDGGLWYFVDGSMYVYYTPTHWWDESAPTPPAPEPDEREGGDEKP